MRLHDIYIANIKINNKKMIHDNSVAYKTVKYYLGKTIETLKQTSSFDLNELDKINKIILKKSRNRTITQNMKCWQGRIQNEWNVRIFKSINKGRFNLPTDIIKKIRISVANATHQAEIKLEHINTNK